jgi:hypothetical protein
MHRTIRRALVPLSVLAVLTVGCSQEDVDKVVAASRERSQQAVPGRHGLGVFMGGGSVDEIHQFERWVGSKVTHVGAFVSQQSWDAFDETSFLDRWRGTGYTLVLGVPLLTENGGGSLKQGADGAYDGHFRQLAADLVAKGQANAILRLGWEFNGDWYKWEAAADPPAFAAYWRHVVDVIRSVPGTDRLRFDWNPAIGPADVPEGSYPGDDYVDIVGMDVYDRNFTAGLADPTKRWEEMVSQPYGLAWQRDFAAAHGKPLSFPEWGTSDRHEGGGAQDNPFFIRSMNEWIRSNNVEYHNYFEFDAPDEDGARLMGGSNPESAALYQQLF